MKIIGFNFTKISAHKSKNFRHNAINTNIEFVDLEKEKLDLLREGEALNLSFKFSVDYINKKLDAEKEDKKEKTKAEEKSGEVVFEGSIILMADKEESKDLLKNWKKKDLSNQIKIPLFNTILKKCSTRALTLEEDINLPSHIPFPKVSSQRPQ